MLLAQLVLRPIHVIRSGLARLGRGELDVDVDLPHDSELGDLGDSFKAVSARLAADRTQLAGQRRRSNRSSITSKTPSRCSRPTARCSSPTRRCAPSLRRHAGTTLSSCCRPAIRTARSSTRRSPSRAGARPATRC